MLAFFFFGARRVSSAGFRGSETELARLQIA
jgi:hypothetical protein